MCSELDLFVNRFPVLLSIFPVETETCALGDLSPVLLASKASSSSHNRLIKVNIWSSQPLSYHLNKQVLIIFKTYHFTFGVVVVNQSFGDMNSSNLRLKVFKRARVSTIWLSGWCIWMVVVPRSYQVYKRTKVNRFSGLSKLFFICLVVASVNCTIISDWNAEKSSNTSSFTLLAIGQSSYFACFEDDKMMILEYYCRCL